ncbi:MAG TPA: tRNA dihydrouridine synthase DusB [Anaerolineae bacterium]|nr:tRNA dihydrouridine synthase DusB [Anaerolineae bacterium]
MRTKGEPTFSIGDIPIYGDLVLAPLAGYSDQPYRAICREMGSAMSYTEFVSAQGVLRGNRRTSELLRFVPAERPVVFQVFGQDPHVLSEACLRLQDLGPDMIDINLGCPSRRVADRGGGSGLLRHPAQIARIFDGLSACLSVPVSAKIRLGWDAKSRNYLEVARIVEQNGAALIAVHGRTRDQDYTVPADWDAIAEVKQTVSIPVLGNGDVRCVADIDRMRNHTGCDGVMIGRAAIGNPWILARRELADVRTVERVEMIRRHLASAVGFYGEARAVLTFRKHLLQYTRGLEGASSLRARLMACNTHAQVLEELQGVLHPVSNVL